MPQLARHRLSILAATCGFWAAAILIALQVPFLSVIWRGEQSVQDWLEHDCRKTRTHSEFVFLGIDQSTLQLPPFTPDELATNRALQLIDRKSTRLNSSHIPLSRMPSSA